MRYTPTVPWHGQMPATGLASHSARGQPACHLQQAASGTRQAVWSLRARCESTPPIPVPHPSTAHGGCLDDGEGAGNGTFFGLRSLVLREAVAEDDEEGRQ